MSQKLLKKLRDTKYRKESGLFLVEGKKNILELLSSNFEVASIYTTLESLESFDTEADTYTLREKCVRPDVILLSQDRLEESGTFKTNNAGIAIAKQKQSISREILLEEALRGYVLILDDVRDPGNLGTIMRTADWFGISHIVTSETSTDCYNPKTIAASMGSFTRITVTALPLIELLQNAKNLNVPTMGSFLDGRNIFETKSPEHGFIIMGSESHGIGEPLISFIDDRVTIPRYGHAESLNVAIATAVILGALRHP